MKRGSATGLVVSTMAFVVLVLGMLFIPLNNANRMLRNNLLAIRSYHVRQAGLARIASLLARDITYGESSVVFSDLGLAFEVAETGREETAAEPVPSGTQVSTYTEYAFSVSNSTTIWLAVDCSPADPLYPYAADITLYAPDGAVVLQETVEGAETYDLPVSRDPLLDPWENADYGTYRLVVSPNNANATIHVSFSRIATRTVRASIAGSNQTYLLKVVNTDSTVNAVSHEGR